MLNKTGKCSTWWKPMVALGCSRVTFASAAILPLIWMRVGEIGGALPSKNVLKEHVCWFIALPHLSGHGESTGGCTCRSLLPGGFQDQQLLKYLLLLLFLLPPKVSVLPWAFSYSTLSFLTHSTVTGTIQGAGSACIQSYNLFSAAAGLQPFFSFHADFELSPHSLQHRLTVSKRPWGK